MSHEILAAWICHACEVEGRSPVDENIACWNCEGPVTVTARPSVAA